MDRTRGQAILITGATGGIGQAMAEALHAAGASVALTGRHAHRLTELAARLGDVPAIAADLTDEAQAAAAVGEAREKLGRLDTLINLAGMSIPGPIAEMSVDDYAAVMNANVRSAFLANKHFLKCVDPEAGGLIVSVSSVAGHQANGTAPVYCAAKAALNMMHQGLALQVKQANVRVSLVSPGAVASPFWGDRQVPHDKFMTPDEVAEVIAFVVNLPSSVVLDDVVFRPWALVRGG
ncbi:MAG: SDR family oxidoreductase [Planctomycetota bacterium]